jgi:hypothetical protein
MYGIALLKMRFYTVLVEKLDVGLQGVKQRKWTQVIGKLYLVIPEHNVVAYFAPANDVIFKGEASGILGNRDASVEFDGAKGKKSVRKT